MHGVSISLKPSKILITWFLLLLLGSVAVISYLTIDPWLKGFLIFFVLSYGSYLIYRYGLLMSKYSIKQLTLNPEICILGNGVDTISAELCGDSTVTTWLCVLRFKVAGTWFKRSCVILKDAIEQGSYRELTIMLRNMKLHGNSR